MFNLTKIRIERKQKKVEKIHTDFDESSNKLVKEAQEIINGALEDPNKVERLKAIGFNVCKDVTKARKKNGNISDAKVILRTRKDYPNNKFLTIPQVVKLCKKYGLIVGTIGRFKGFVPEKNLKEIEEFKFHFTDSALKDNWNSYSKKGLQICAPKRYFNTEGTEIRRGFFLTEDPIVLQPMRGGYLVITAWGLESEDPMLK